MKLAERLRGSAPLSWSATALPLDRSTGPSPYQKAALLSMLSASCLTLLVLLLCLPPLHSAARALLGPRVAAAAVAGLPTVVSLQRRLESRPATLLFAAVSSTVSVPFYVSVLPAVIWLVDYEAGVRLAFALGVSLYVGNGLKDLVCAPRPLAMKGAATATRGRRGRRRNAAADAAVPATTAVRLLTADDGGASERKSVLEYGFPSSHVMNTLVLNLHAVECLLLRRRGSDPSGGTGGSWSWVRRSLSSSGDAAGLPSSSPSSFPSLPSSLPVPAARSLAVAWTALVALARVYCGMHSPVDVLGGAVAGLAVVAALALEDVVGGDIDSSSSSSSPLSSPPSSPSLDARYISWLSSSGPRAALAHALATALLLRLHPLPLTYTTSFEATTAFAGACAGVALGVSTSGGGFGFGVGSRGSLGFKPPPSSTTGTLAAALRRLVAGLAAVAVAKEASKRIVLAVVPLPYRACPLWLRRLWQPPVRSLPPSPSTGRGGRESRDRTERLGIPVDGAGRPWDEVLTAKFFSYAALGWGVAGLAPAAFVAAGI